jgi:DNA polymerase III delta prime subunit
LSGSEGRPSEPRWWPGQAHLWRAAGKMRREGKIAHAWLLVGMEDLPAMPYARAFARWLLCLAPTDQGPCNACTECQWAQSEHHPDLWASGSGESWVGVDAVREALRWIQYRPQRSAWRPVWIPQAERMGAEAVAALLKSLEEPPGGVVWILATHRPGRLSDAVRSRCLEVVLRPVPTRELERWLMDHGVGAAQAARAAKAAEGLPQVAWETAMGQPRPPDAQEEEVRQALHEAYRSLHQRLARGLVAAAEGEADLAALSFLAEASVRRGFPARSVREALKAMSASWSTPS